MTGRVVAVDVGTASVRAAVIDERGAVEGRGLVSIAYLSTGPDRAVYTSTAIWAAVCAAVRAALAEAAVPPDGIAAIGFDATCSLVLRDRNGRSLELEAGADTLAWCDHRARDEADACTATGNAALSSLGGVMSPEMQLPKLLWLKRHRPDLWPRLGLAFDLADFLTWRATGETARSRCTLASKWLFDAGETDGWPTEFFDLLGLDDLVERCGLPANATPVGSDLGPLLSDSAAELGLTPQCRVAAGLIDAHAGALGLLGTTASDGHAALVAGTSSCVMAVSSSPSPGAGLWGPHWETVLPARWTLEGGQSASGALLDHILSSSRFDTCHAAVVDRIEELRGHAGPDLAPRLHMVPDFKGCRSPMADPRALGVISGLDLDGSFDSLCRLYWRACVAIALGVRDVLEAFAATGREVSVLHVAGGHARSSLLLQLYADATGRPVRAAAGEPGDAMLRGGAIGASVAAGFHRTVAEAAHGMAAPAEERRPNPAARARLERDYRVQRLMREHRRALDDILAEHAMTARVEAS